MPCKRLRDACPSLGLPMLLAGLVVSVFLLRFMTIESLFGFFSSETAGTDINPDMLAFPCVQGVRFTVGSKCLCPPERFGKHCEHVEPYFNEAKPGDGNEYLTRLVAHGRIPLSNPSHMLRAEVSLQYLDAWMNTRQTVIPNSCPTRFFSIAMARDKWSGARPALIEGIVWANLTDSAFVRPYVWDSRISSPWEHLLRRSNIPAYALDPSFKLGNISCREGYTGPFSPAAVTTPKPLSAYLDISNLKKYTYDWDDIFRCTADLTPKSVGGIAPESPPDVREYHCDGRGEIEASGAARSVDTPVVLMDLINPGVCKNSSGSYVCDYEKFCEPTKFTLTNVNEPFAWFQYTYFGKSRHQSQFLSKVEPNAVARYMCSQFKRPTTLWLRYRCFDPLEYTIWTNSMNVSAFSFRPTFDGDGRKCRTCKRDALFDSSYDDVVDVHFVVLHDYINSVLGTDQSLEVMKAVSNFVFSARGADSVGKLRRDEEVFSKRDAAYVLNFPDGRAVSRRYEEVMFPVNPHIVKMADDYIKNSLQGKFVGVQWRLKKLMQKFRSVGGRYAKMDTLDLLLSWCTERLDELSSANFSGVPLYIAHDFHPFHMFDAKEPFALCTDEAYIEHRTSWDIDWGSEKIGVRQVIYKILNSFVNMTRTARSLHSSDIRRMNLVDSGELAMFDGAVLSKADVLYVGDPRGADAGAVDDDCVCALSQSSFTRWVTREWQRPAYYSTWDDTVEATKLDFRNPNCW